MVYDCMPKLHDEERDFLSGRDPTYSLVADGDISAVVSTDTSILSGGRAICIGHA